MPFVEPRKVCTDLSNGDSEVFCGQWMPQVLVQLKMSYGSGGEIKVTFKGSIDPDHENWITIDEHTWSEGDAAVVKFAKPSDEWYLYYKLSVETSDGETYVSEAYIGAGGA